MKLFDRIEVAGFKIFIISVNGDVGTIKNTTILFKYLFNTYVFFVRRWTVCLSRENSTREKFNWRVVLIGN